MLRHKIIVLTGCTASGKSSIAIRLAKEIGAVIINADSRQIYKELNIGSAKPVPDYIKDGIYYIQQIPHYLYSTISIKEKYSIYQYQKDVKKILKTIPTTTPVILLGGTGLYIDSVIKDFKLTESKDDDSFNNYSVLELQKMVGEDKLQELNESDRENPRRLIRIIQKSLTTKTTVKSKPLDHIYIVIDMNKEILNKRIERRVKEMIREGLLKENKELREAGFEKYRAFKTIGYQEFDPYFQKEEDIENITKQIINHTKQYAKRQRTWFRRNKNAVWCKNYEEILENVKNFLR